MTSKLFAKNFPRGRYETNIEASPRTPSPKVTANLESSGNVLIGRSLSEIGKSSIHYKTADIIATIESRCISFDKKE